MTTTNGNKASPTASSTAKASSSKSKAAKGAAASSSKSIEAVKKSTLEKHRVETGTASRKISQKLLDFPKKDAMAIDSAVVSPAAKDTDKASKAPMITPDKGGHTPKGTVNDEDLQSQDGKRKAVDITTATEKADVTSPAKKKATEFKFDFKLPHHDIKKFHSQAKKSIAIIKNDKTYTKVMDDKFIHALCIITGVDIDFRRVPKWARLQMLEESMEIINDPSFEHDPAFHHQSCYELLCQLCSADKPSDMNMDDQLAFLLAHLRGGKIKSFEKIDNWSIIPQVLGVFLPKKGFRVERKINYVATANARIRQSNWSILKFNEFTLAVINNFTGTELGLNRNIPGVLGDKGIPIKTRQEMAKILGFDIQSEDNFGTPTWCVLGHDCNLDIRPSELLCETCKKPVHAECGSLTKKGLICAKCRPITSVVIRPNQGYRLLEAVIEPIEESTTAASPTAGELLVPRSILKSGSRGVQFGSADSVRILPAQVREYTTLRYSLKLQLPNFNEDDEDGCEVVCKTLSDMFKVLLKADPLLSILNWKANETNHPPLNLEDMPKTMEGVQVYVDRARAASGKIIWCDLRLQHVRAWSCISQEINSWLKNRGHGIYPRRLQEERTKSIGWFLMSTSSLSTECLCKALKNTYGISIDIRWSMLRLTRTETFVETPPKAQTIWCAEDCEVKYKRILDDIYNVGSNYPLAIRMRFMPLIREGSTKFLLNSRILRERHEGFNQTIMNVTVDTISALDWQPKNKSIPTLREIIMSRKTQRKQHSLFTAVNVGWQSNLTTFSFPKRHKKEAKAYLLTISGRMIHKYTSDAYPWFTSAAITDGRHMSYDEATDTMITEDELISEQLIAFTDKLFNQEIARDTDAMAHGELDSTSRLEEALAANKELAQDQDSTHDEETEFQKEVLNNWLGDKQQVTEDLGTIKSGVTNQSQVFTGKIATDRSTVRTANDRPRFQDDNSTIATQQDDLNQDESTNAETTTTGHDQQEKDNDDDDNPEEKMDTDHPPIFTNLDLLKEREQQLEARDLALKEQQEDMDRRLRELRQEMERFEQMKLQSTAPPALKHTAPPEVEPMNEDEEVIFSQEPDDEEAPEDESPEDDENGEDEDHSKHNTEMADDDDDSDDDDEDEPDESDGDSSNATNPPVTDDEPEDTDADTSNASKKPADADESEDEDEDDDEDPSNSSKKPDGASGILTNDSKNHDNDASAEPKNDTSEPEANQVDETDNNTNHSNHEPSTHNATVSSPWQRTMATQQSQSTPTKSAETTTSEDLGAQP